MHYLNDIPNIVHEMKRRYPDIKVEVSEPLGTHPLMTEIIMQRIDGRCVDEIQQVGVIVVTHMATFNSRVYKHMKVTVMRSTFAD